MMLITFSLILYMLFAALRVGIIIHSGFIRDLNKLQKNIEDEKIKQRRVNALISHLEIFLEDYEQEEARKKASKVNDIINQRKQN